MRPLPSSLLALALAFTLCAPAHAEPPDKDKHDLFQTTRSSEFIAYRFTETCAAGLRALGGMKTRELVRNFLIIGAASYGTARLAETNYVRTFRGTLPARSWREVDYLLEHSDSWFIGDMARQTLRSAQNEQKQTVRLHLLARLRNIVSQERIENLKYVAEFGPTDDSQFENLLLAQLQAKLKARNISKEEMEATLGALRHVGGTKTLRAALRDFGEHTGVADLFGENTNWTQRYFYSSDYLKLLQEPLDDLSLSAADRVSGILDRDQTRSAQINAILGLQEGNPYAFRVLQKIDIPMGYTAKVYGLLGKVKPEEVDPDSTLAWTLKAHCLPWALRDWQSDFEQGKDARTFFRLYPRYAPAGFTPEPH